MQYTFQFTVSSSYIVNKRFEVQKKLFCREESNNYNTRNGMLLCICAVNQNSLCIHSEHTLQSFPVDRLHSDKHTTVRPQYTIVYYSPPQYTKTHHSILKYTTVYYSKLNYTTGYYRTPQHTLSSLLLGTRQTQVVPKLVSRGWMQRRQQRFSYPDWKRNSNEQLAGVS